MGEGAEREPKGGGVVEGVERRSKGSRGGAEGALLAKGTVRRKGKRQNDQQ